MKDKSSKIEFDGEKIVLRPMTVYKVVQNEVMKKLEFRHIDIQLQKDENDYIIPLTASNEFRNNSGNCYSMFNFNANIIFTRKVGH